MKTLTETEYQDLIKELVNIKTLLLEKQKHPSEILYDNSDFIRHMKISKRTAQDWRDEGLIAFSKVGSKIYYQHQHVMELIDSHLKPPSKKK